MDVRSNVLLTVVVLGATFVDIGGFLMDHGHANGRTLPSYLSIYRCRITVNIGTYGIKADSHLNKVECVQRLWRWLRCLVTVVRSCMYDCVGTVHVCIDILLQTQ
jgi:hypothetical protein